MKNPPAFPQWSEQREQGMTLRDYFAAKALQGMLANAVTAESLTILQPRELENKIAKAVYKMADAMLQER